MKTERPILFSGAMVRAVLEGRKTQTRRVVKPHPDGVLIKDGSILEASKKIGKNGIYTGRFKERGCPYGKPGDRLWVRETTCIAPKRWATPDDTCRTDYDGDKRYVSYKADGQPEDAMRDYKLSWTPSIHVPRWASRIDLEITGVRVERLQDISERDARAEGITMVPFFPDDGWPLCDGFMVGEDDGKTPLHHTAKKAFEQLWDSINGKQKPNKPDVSWAANPWVWVVEFRRVEMGKVFGR